MDLIAEYRHKLRGILSENYRLGLVQKLSVLMGEAEKKLGSSSAACSVGYRGYIYDGNQLGKLVKTPLFYDKWDLQRILRTMVRDIYQNNALYHVEVVYYETSETTEKTILELFRHRLQEMVK